MKRGLKVLLFVVVLLFIFVAHIFISTGFFRDIENRYEGEIVHTINIPGAEDITISSDKDFAIISSTNRAKYRDTGKLIGDLYIMDLSSNNFITKNLTAHIDLDFGPHGISMIQQNNTHIILAINHSEAGETIEKFVLENNTLTHTNSISDASMISLNDVVMIDEQRFYFTNDHKYTEGLGKLSEDYLGRTLCNVIYFDGNSFREVANDIGYANGINYDADRALLFVASPRKFLIKVYKVLQNGDLDFIEDIPCGTGVDNIEFDKDGNLWSGCHPNLLQFSAYAAGKKEIAPSEIIKIAYRGKNDYTVETVYLEDGSIMSAASVAAPFKNYILAGNVMDDSFLILKQH